MQYLLEMAFPLLKKTQTNKKALLKPTKNPNQPQKCLWADSCELLQVFCAQTARHLGLVSHFFCGEKSHTSVTWDIIQLDCCTAVRFTA